MNGTSLYCRIYACLGRPRSDSNNVLSESEYAAAAADGWDPIIKYIESRNLSVSGLAFSTGMSNLRGVTWHAAKKQWQTMMNVNGKPLHIYSGKNQSDAAMAYDSANHYVHGYTPE
jgi:hypothetical protein